jgi:phage terminase large subunit GpA-like protein
MTIANPRAINTVLADIFRPRSRESCLQWVQRNVALSKRFSPREGPYDVSYTPYLAPVHEWFSDESVRTITSPKGAQIGYTTFMGNAMSWAVCEDPGPVMYITSTAENAQSWGEREWLPRIDLCPPLKKLVPGNRDMVKKTEQHFLTATVKLVGAQSDNNLKSRPIRYLLCDEVDTWPDGFLGQAEARTLSYRGIDKIVRGSTCTSEEGAIWLAWLRSTQHQWHVPCPHCGKYQVLSFFDHIKWPAHHRDLLGKWDIESVRRDTHGQCIDCGGIWKPSQQRDIIRAGEAVSTNPHASPTDKGLHIPSLLSPTLSWGDLAALWLRKKDEPGGREDFFNQYLGLPWSRDDFRVTEDKLLAARRQDYLLKQCPVHPAAVILCADPGERMTHWSVYAFQKDGTQWLIDYGTVHTIEDLIPLAAGLEYPIQQSTKRVRVTKGLIDSGYATERVYRTCRASRGLFSPSKGSSAEFGQPVASGKIAAFPMLTLYTYVDNIAKNSLYLDALSRRVDPLIWWPANVGQDWVDGHAGQEIRSKQVSNRTIKFWKPLPNDHFGDTSKLALVAWWVMRQGLGHE